MYSLYFKNEKYWFDEAYGSLSFCLQTLAHKTKANLEGVLAFKILLNERDIIIRGTL